MEELDNYRRGLIKGYQEIETEIESMAEVLTVEDRDLMQEGTDWNARQVFSHMRDVEAGYFLPFIKRVLVGDKSELEVFEDKEKRGVEINKEEQLAEIISDFKANHTILTAMLDEMSIQDWNLTGRCQQSGMHSVQWYLEQNLAHLKAHVKQLAGN